MIVLRSLLSVLLLAALLAPSTARANEEEEQAALFVTLFEMMCPALMNEGLSSGGDMAALEGPILTAIGGDACDCINGSLKAMSPREINALTSEDGGNEGIEPMLARCTALAIQPRISEVCLVGATEKGVAKDDPMAVSMCGCVQARADAMSEEEITALFSTQDDDAFNTLFEGCDPDA